MRQRIPLALCFLSIAHAQTPPSPTTLAQLRDRFRPLLLFAANPDDPSLLAQMTRLKNLPPGLRERDILVIVVPFNSPSPTGTSLTPADASISLQVTSPHSSSARTATKSCAPQSPSPLLNFATP